MPNPNAAVADNANAVSNDVWNGRRFLGACQAYSGVAKIKRLVDCLCVGSADERETVLNAALEIVATFENMAEHGSGYTPGKDVLGGVFGSNSAAVIAETFLGRASSQGDIRKNLAKAGK